MDLDLFDERGVNQIMHITIGTGAISAEREYRLLLSRQNQSHVESKHDRDRPVSVLLLHGLRDATLDLRLHGRRRVTLDLRLHGRRGVTLDLYAVSGFGHHCVQGFDEHRRELFS